MINIFLKKSYTKCRGEASPRPFYEKNQKSEYFWINSLKLYTIVFIVYPIQWLPKYLETKVLTNSFCIIQWFLKNKKRSGTSLPVSFSAGFLKKNFFHVTFH